MFDREDDDDDDDSETVAFPRISDRIVEKEPAAGEVLLRISQRRASEHQTAFEVKESADGGHEIPMTISATTISSWLPKEVLLRSPWIARGLSAPEGTALAREFAEDRDDFEEIMAGETTHYAVTLRRTAEAVLDVGLPSAGAGQRMLAPRGLLQCLELCAPASDGESAVLPSTGLFTLFLWATVLELNTLAESCRNSIDAAINPATVALALAVGHLANDSVLLHRCYWCIRELMCNASGLPATWVDGKGAVRLIRGALCHVSICRTPLRALDCVVKADYEAKSRWTTASDCYTLTQVHRHRQEGGSYPHTYEMRLDHSNETVMTALREDEQSDCRIFLGNAATTSASEHCEEFLGTVCRNFWGTAFTLYDGSDAEALVRNIPVAKDLPIRQRAQICTIGYETNILGDCPRKITYDVERKNERYHMENVAPRWDSKLNSYALPFFGRVKKASAKNFQLVVNNDPNTIYLMFGKISKDVFCLDFRGPIAPLDAMAIAIASLAKKRAVS